MHDDKPEHQARANCEHALRSAGVSHGDIQKLKGLPGINWLALLQFVTDPNNQAEAKKLVEGIIAIFGGGSTPTAE